MDFREQIALDLYRKRLQTCKDELKRTEKSLERLGN
jgi:hypothetical protein